MCCFPPMDVMLFHGDKSSSWHHYAPPMGKFSQYEVPSKVSVKSIDVIVINYTFYLLPPSQTSLLAFLSARSLLLLATHHRSSQRVYRNC